MNSRNGFLFATSMALFFALIGVSCKKEFTANGLEPLPPKFERKFKYKKCYTYDYTDTGGYVLSNINTKVYNAKGVILESFDSIYHGKQYLYSTSSVYTFFGNDSMHEAHQTNGNTNFTYSHFFSNKQLNSTFIEGTWMYFAYYGDYMVKMVLPADPSNPKEEYQYYWDKNGNMTQITVNGFLWQKFEYTTILNQNNDGEFWESGRNSANHPSKTSYFETGSGALRYTIESDYHVTPDGFVDTCTMTKTFFLPSSSVAKRKLIYVR
jgi:hypothetical protein